MTVEKFGLVELERYEGEVGFKKSDVRIIKGVCAIVDLPVTVVPEVQEVIASYNKNITNSEKQVVKIEADDNQNNEETKQGIARLKDDRKVTKSVNKQAVAVAKSEAGSSSNEVVRLQKLLKNFS